VHSFLEPS
jgi:hypothetical protein